MHAAEIKVEELFKSDNQLLVPLWQRRYAWQRSQWDELWRDLTRVDQATSAGEVMSHFVGSVVLHAQEGTGLPSEAHRYLVVDGQQRVTTLTLLICAIRDHIARADVDDAARSRTRELYTSRYLRNTNLAHEYQERLVLQQPDRSALALVIDGTPGESSSLIDSAYRFFSERLSAKTGEQALALLTHIAKRLTAVWVVLEVGDNAHRVFQTLNSGGRRLAQADLVRNYFFLLLGDQGDQFYVDHWRHLEADVPTAKLEDYLSAWAVSEGHVGAKGALFGYFQKDLGPIEGNAAAILEYGEAFVAGARLYRFIQKPGEMPGISNETRRALTTLSKWRTDPADGLLLLLLRRHAMGSISEAELRDAAEIVLSYLARRFLAGFAPNRHRSIFVRIAQRLIASERSGTDLVGFLRALLSALDDDNAWPSDIFLSERVATTAVYTRARTKWTFLVLERINRTFFTYQQHAPEALDDTVYSVEHVLPQTLSRRWEEDLTTWGVESPAALHSTHLHVLGNLTLSAINSNMQNKPLEEKQRMLSDDTLKLNVEVVSQESWEAAVIDRRGQGLIARATESFVGPISKQMIAAQYPELSGEPIEVEEVDDLEEIDDEGFGEDSQS